MIRAGTCGALCAEKSRPWVLAATILGSSMAFIDSTVVNVALPALQSDLHATVVDVEHDHFGDRLREYQRHSSVLSSRSNTFPRSWHRAAMKVAYCQRGRLRELRKLSTLPSGLRSIRMLPSKASSVPSATSTEWAYSPPEITFRCGFDSFRPHQLLCFQIGRVLLNLKLSIEQVSRIKGCESLIPKDRHCGSFDSRWGGFGIARCRGAFSKTGHAADRYHALRGCGPIEVERPYTRL
jgi:hypothetical protein